MAVDHRGIALVTGASSGVGAVYAERLAARGYDLLLVARRSARLDAAASRLKAATAVAVDTIVADLAREEGIARIARAIEDCPNLSMVVNNAGSGALGTAAEVDPMAVEDMLAVNVLALTRLSLVAARRFLATGQGAIINIASILAAAPAAGAAAYAGSKSFVLNFTQSLHADVGSRGVRVQAVLPGATHSEFFGAKPYPFPDDLFMSAEAMVDAALAGFDQGEVVTMPTLDDVATWDRLEDARQALWQATFRGGDPAARYRSGSKTLAP